MDNVFGFSKDGFPPDSEIEEMYIKTAESVEDRVIQDKLFRALLYDPRRSDIYFGTEEDAHKAEEIAHKLNSMSKESFLTSGYAYEWLDELSGAQIFKIVDPKVLKKAD